MPSYHYTKYCFYYLMKLRALCPNQENGYAYASIAHRFVPFDLCPHVAGLGAKRQCPRRKSDSISAQFRAIAPRHLHFLPRRFEGYESADPSSTVCQTDAPEQCLADSALSPAHLSAWRAASDYFFCSGATKATVQPQSHLSTTKEARGPGENRDLFINVFIFSSTLGWPFDLVQFQYRKNGRSGSRSDFLA